MWNRCCSQRKGVNINFASQYKVIRKLRVGRRGRARRYSGIIAIFILRYKDGRKVGLPSCWFSWMTSVADPNVTTKPAYWCHFIMSLGTCGQLVINRGIFTWVSFVVIVILGNVCTNAFYFMVTIITVDAIITDSKGYFSWFQLY